MKIQASQTKLIETHFSQNFKFKLQNSKEIIERNFTGFQKIDILSIIISELKKNINQRKNKP